MLQPQDPSNAILNQFSPLKRKTLMLWLRESHLARRSFHRSFLASLEEVIHSQHVATLDRRTKILFTTFQEFGSRLSPKTVRNSLVDLIEQRLNRRPD